MVCGVPMSGPEQLMSVVQAVTVIVLVNLPTPRTLAEAGKTVASPAVGPVILMSEIERTARPVATILMKTVPLDTPRMVALTIWPGGVAPVPAARSPHGAARRPASALRPPERGRRISGRARRAGARRRVLRVAAPALRADRAPSRARGGGQGGR